MAKKSVRSRLTRSKRKKSGISSPRPVSPDKPAAPATASAPHSEVIAPAARTTGTRGTPVQQYYPSVAAEIKRIGMLAGIILAVLGVLAVVLP